MRTLKVLSAGIAGAAVLGMATVPAFAAPAHQPFAELTANQIAKKANADFQAASSFSVWARASIHGITVTATETIGPRGCLVTDNSGDGFWTQLLTVDGSIWIRQSDQTWEALGYTGTVLGEVAGKWVTLAAYLQALGLQNPGPVSGDCHSHEPSGLPSSGWTLGRTLVKVSGHWAWQLSHKVGKHQSVQADVSDTRTPEFVRATVLGITEYFSHYNAPVTLTAPPASDVLTSIPPAPNQPTPAIGRLIRGAGLLPGFDLEVAK